MYFENLNYDWKDFLKSLIEKSYFKNLEQSLNEAYQINKVYPPQNLIFNAFNLCSINQIKVIIIGQDPYHNYFNLINRT